jgi:dimethylhistidine N-methyltransferase
VARDLALTPKQIQSKYLYDALGSSLFESICRLPWYRITRAESRLLARSANEMVAPLEDPVTLLELGSGSGEKVALLAEALRTRRRRVAIHLVDISPTALELSERTLGALEHGSVGAHRATSAAGLRRAARDRPALGGLLVLFLGSNIGNFDTPAAHEFLSEIRRALRPGDALLLGTDLVKPVGELLLAYDDPLGVTAAFNKNLLVRMNRELQANFDLTAFEHHAVWNSVDRRVEMHLVSVRPQTVGIPQSGVDVAFGGGESIWTESSYKYDAREIVELVSAQGFSSHSQWMDPEARFALTLFVAE